MSSEALSSRAERAVTPGRATGVGTALTLPFDDARLDEPAVVLSYGMGADSTALLLRWLDDLESRDFPLDRLVVATAMTGDEFPDTVTLVESHVLPRLREADVRFVQLARRGPRQADGVIVLDDSRAPDILHAAGPWRLSDELASAGTLPQVASGRRTCSMKFKGWVLDTFLARELGGAPYWHVLGLNADEVGRADRDRSYSAAHRQSQYPLIEWGWDRERCESFIAATVGVAWPKSCCSYCPFAADRHIDRYRQFPKEAAQALMLEATSRALNPAVRLFGRTSLRGELLLAGLHAIVATPTPP